ncbi:MAG: hypothetical protein ACYTAN_08985 [Planctomycetota bacterium]|jgi:endonuclease III
MTAAKKKSRRKSKAALATFAGKCLMTLKRKAGARNLAAPDGDLAATLLLAMIARGCAVTAAREAYAGLKESFVDWNELRVTRPAQISFYLQGIKNGREKAQIIADVLGSIFEGTHDLGLAFLVEASAQEAKDYLTGLSGLDEQTVTEVILSGGRFFHMSADTDVVRVARRLGLIGRNTTPGGFERDVVELLGQEKAYQLTFLLKELSETICTVHGQRCDECVLAKVCPARRVKKSR